LPELAFFQPILAEARNCPGVTPAIRWKLKKSGTPAAKPKHSGQCSESEIGFPQEERKSPQARARTRTQNPVSMLLK
jgi:hypothetical protein